MSQITASHSPLRTFEGELLQLSISLPLRQLENTLDALGQLPFPVNPEVIRHQQDANHATVRFPAYDRRLAAVIGSLERAGLPAASLDISPTFG